MTKIFTNQEFRSFIDRNSGRVYQDLEFRNCHFMSSAVSITRNLRRRSTVKNVSFYQCEVTGCSVDTVIAEDIIVSGLKTHGLLQCWGAVFKHVTLKGNIGEIMISPLVATGMAKPKEQAAFDEVNARYYETVDWALDISEARFYDCDIRRIPAHLIRRDPETQVVVTREKALMGKWRELDLSKTYWATGIQFMLNRGDRDVVLVAPKRDPKYPDLLDGLKMLRDAGVAEPD